MKLERRLAAMEARQVLTGSARLRRTQGERVLHRRTFASAKRQGKSIAELAALNHQSVTCAHGLPEVAVMQWPKARGSGTDDQFAPLQVIVVWLTCNVRGERNCPQLPPCTGVDVSRQTGPLPSCELL